MSYFARIQPCGFNPAVMTSMAAELSREVSMAEVQDALVEDLGVTLGRRFAAAPAPVAAPRPPSA